LFEILYATDSFWGVYSTFTWAKPKVIKTKRKQKEQMKLALIKTDEVHEEAGLRAWLSESMIQPKNDFS